MSRIKTTELPNGWRLHYRHELDRKILAREFAADDIYEHEFIQLTNGACIFDVGANLGSFCLWLAERLDSATVFCFEPLPESFELLALNVDHLLGIDVRLENCGLSDRDGTTTFLLQAGLSVSASMIDDQSARKKAGDRQFVAEEIRSLHPWLRSVMTPTVERLGWPVLEGIRRLYSRRQKIECQLATVSQMIQKYALQKIDLLKIDVEGAEQQVINGIEPQHWPMIEQLLVECHLGAEQAQGIAGQLSKHGFATDVQPVNPKIEHLFMLAARKE